MQRLKGVESQICPYLGRATAKFLQDKYREDSRSSKKVM